MSRTLLHKTKFAEHQYDEAQNTIYTNWFPATEHMTSEEFKYEMEQWVAVTEKENPALIYDFCCNFIYPINPDEQIWMTHLLNPAWINAGVKKYAHIVPQEFITNLSVEQMFEEFYDMKLPNQFAIEHFAEEDHEKAKEWLFKK